MKPEFDIQQDRRDEALDLSFLDINARYGEGMRAHDTVLDDSTLREVSMDRVEWRCTFCERWNILGVNSCTHCLKPKFLDALTRLIPDLARKQAEQWNRKLGIHHKHLKKK